MEFLKKGFIDLNETCDFLRDNDNFIILTHANPDGDTLGSAFGLAMLLKGMDKRVRVLCPDNIPEKYRYFTKYVAFDCEEDKNATVVAVDVADPKLLGSLEESFSSRVLLCIDHHISNKCYAKYTYLDGNAAANCECIYDIAVALGERVDKKMALALYTGISTDTGCFRFSNTTSKTLRIAADLMERKIDTAEINRIMFETKSKGRLELEKQAVEGLEYHFSGKCAIVTVTRKMLLETGCNDEEIEGVTSISRGIEGVMVGVTVRERKEGGFKASIRTYPPIDAAEICKKMGGGGHIRAAGCQFDPELTEKDVKNIILGHIKTALES